MIKVLKELSWFDQTYLFCLFILVLFLPIISPKTLPVVSVCTEYQGTNVLRHLKQMKNTPWRVVRTEFYGTNVLRK